MYVDQLAAPAPSDRHFAEGLDAVAAAAGASHAPHHAADAPEVPGQQLHDGAGFPKGAAMQHIGALTVGGRQHGELQLGSAEDALGAA